MHSKTLAVGQNSSQTWLSVQSNGWGPLKEEITTGIRYRTSQHPLSQAFRIRQSFVNSRDMDFPQQSYGIRELYRPDNEAIEIEWVFF